MNRIFAALEQVAIDFEKARDAWLDELRTRLGVASFSVSLKPLSASLGLRGAEISDALDALAADGRLEITRINHADR